MSAGRPNGRTVVTARALERVVRAVTAEQFGVDPKSVSADLTDDGGRLDLALRTPVRTVSIGRLQEDRRSVERSGGSIVDRAAEGESAIAERVTTITGSTVSRLSLRFTEAVIRTERRVR